MCRHCWSDYGAPDNDSEEVRAAVSLISAVFDEHLAGGALHIVIDDWNLEDDSLDWCQSKKLTPAEKACLKALRSLSVADRASALARFDGYL